MKTLTEYRDIIKAQGYNEADANARLCQDIILKALASSSLSRNATIKGGVVMRSISGDIRRATQDMDIDFIRYSLSDECGAIIWLHMRLDTRISSYNLAL